jgi:Family of unknown function (DUF6308)
LADQYGVVNPILLELAKKLGIDVWTLDYLWWYIATRAPSQSPSSHASVQNSRASDQKGGLAGFPANVPASTSAMPKVGMAEAPFALPSGLTFSLGKAESRLMRFCGEEFGYYDGIVDQVPARIEPIDVIVTVAINSFVNSALLIRTVHRGLSSRCNSLLARIPVDADLMTYDPPLSEFRGLIGAAIQSPQVLVSVATKVLHRKRRNFIPILDNVIIKHYATALKHPDWLEKSQSKSTAASVGVEVLKAFREDLQYGFTRLIPLRTSLANAGFDLTLVRILEILVWTETEPNGYYRMG